MICDFKNLSVTVRLHQWSILMRYLYRSTDFPQGSEIWWTFIGTFMPICRWLAFDDFQYDFITFDHLSLWLNFISFSFNDFSYCLSYWWWFIYCLDYHVDYDLFIMSIILLMIIYLSYRLSYQLCRLSYQWFDLTCWV